MVLTSNDCTGILLHATTPLYLCNARTLFTSPGAWIERVTLQDDNQYLSLYDYCREFLRLGMVVRVVSVLGIWQAMITLLPCDGLPCDEKLRLPF